MRVAGEAGHELTLVVPDELLQAVAERIADLVLARTETTSRTESPWLTSKGRWPTSASPATGCTS